MTDGPGELGRKLVRDMPRFTHQRHGPLGLENARFNLRYRSHGRTLRELRGQLTEKGDEAIVIGAGPSLHRRPAAGTLKKARYEGTLVVTDSALSYCLRNGLVPDVVVTLDPHATRIVRWFGDPALRDDDLVRDDYHRRQDMDPVFANEARANREILAALDEHGHKIRIALSSSASRAVVERVLATGMDIYWWNPMYDDPTIPDGLTAQLQKLNRLPSMNAGGNVGSACWMLAHAVLGKKHVALVGIDLSYYADTPYSSTQYYREALDLVGESGLDSVYMRVYNPHIDAWFYTDPAYMWYRESFLEMVKDADCQTYNCSEGGILFGDGIEFLSLDSFLGRRAAG